MQENKTLPNQLTFCKKADGNICPRNEANIICFVKAAEFGEEINIEKT